MTSECAGCASLEGEPVATSFGPEILCPKCADEWATFYADTTAGKMETLSIALKQIIRKAINDWKAQ